jgi:hypothetical protein
VLPCHALSNHGQRITEGFDELPLSLSLSLSLLFFVEIMVVG